MKSKKNIDNLTERDMQRFGMALSNYLDGKIENVVVNMTISDNALTVKMWSADNQIAEFTVDSSGFYDATIMPKQLSEEIINHEWNVLQNKKSESCMRSFEWGVGA